MTPMRENEIDGGAECTGAEQQEGVQHAGGRSFILTPRRMVPVLASFVEEHATREKAMAFPMAVGRKLLDRAHVTQRLSNDDGILARRCFARCLLDGVRTLE